MKNIFDNLTDVDEILDSYLYTLKMYGYTVSNVYKGITTLFFKINDKVVFQHQHTTHNKKMFIHSIKIKRKKEKGNLPLQRAVKSPLHLVKILAEWKL